MAKKNVKKKVKVEKKISPKKVKAEAQKSKFLLVANNLLIFVIFSLVFLILSRLVVNTFLINLFTLSTILFCFVAVGFLLALLVLLILKFMKK